ncbi:MAG: hypothetical protein Q8835_03025, partial [Sweet potato little leaf phytoplasma]|nr:hypothetical protein [Sweet potato little leaf phytoplasma]
FDGEACNGLRRKMDVINEPICKLLYPKYSDICNLLSFKKKTTYKITFTSCADLLFYNDYFGFW